VNLLTHFNGWFLLYLFLTISLVLSTAPSSQDLKNAAIGIFLLFTAVILVVWSGFSPLVYLLDGGMFLLGIGFTLGFVYGSIALIISSPLILWYGYTRNS
jgi:bacteriorhodopsin